MADGDKEPPRTPRYEYNPRRLGRIRVQDPVTLLPLTTEYPPEARESPPVAEENLTLPVIGNGFNTRVFYRSSLNDNDYWDKNCGSNSQDNESYTNKHASTACLHCVTDEPRSVVHGDEANGTVPKVIPPKDEDFDDEDEEWVDLSEVISGSASSGEAETNAPCLGAAALPLSTSASRLEEWVNAPEFIPSSASNSASALPTTPSVAPQADACGGGAKPRVYTSYPSAVYPHGDVCDICKQRCLHPKDKFRRRMHRRLCQQRQNKDAVSTQEAIDRSKGKMCGICFEAVMEKPINERRFGILPMCNHCFCLECIRKWRQARSFENKVVKSCPQCRVTSDFVCPSIYWVDAKEEKDVLIDKYKNALSEKPCKYYKQGSGPCPFGNKCFYLHALPDGTKTDLGPPARRRRTQHHEDFDLSHILQQIILWDVHDDQEHRWLYSFADDLDELMTLFSDSDDSEWSDFDFF